MIDKYKQGPAVRQEKALTRFRLCERSRIMRLASLVCTAEEEALAAERRAAAQAQLQQQLYSELQKEMQKLAQAPSVYSKLQRAAAVENEALRQVHSCVTRTCVPVADTFIAVETKERSEQTAID